MTGFDCTVTGSPDGASLASVKPQFPQWCAADFRDRGAAASCVSGPKTPIYVRFCRSFLSKKADERQAFNLPAVIDVFPQPPWLGSDSVPQYNDVWCACIARLVISS
jgi:hypothetical protein